MGRKPRDRDAEKIAIAAAADRLLAGTPLRSTSGKLTATELIIESGLRRDVVYEHDKTVENFTARVKACNAVPEAMQQLADTNQQLKKDLEEIRAALTHERGKTKVLLRIASELSLELEQAREQLIAAHHVTRLTRRSPTNPVAKTDDPSCADE